MTVSKNLEDRGFTVKDNIIVAGNGAGLLNLLTAGEQWLAGHVTVVNNLNVFPVPDGDTGTNMLLTIRAALNGVNGDGQQHAGMVAVAAAHGALMGARGNSGVILSQFLQGLADGLAGKNVFTAADLASATGCGADLAYQSVMEPVEGTILTVARAVAQAAQEQATRSDDLLSQVEAITEAASIAQSSTPELLPILKEAGVTDSGGQGLLYIIEGWLRLLRNQSLSNNHDEVSVPALHSQLGVERREFGYDVQFLIQGSQLDPPTIRRQVNQLGWSTVVVGDAETVKVHVHADDPGLPLSYGVSLGNLTDVVVENLGQQARAFVRQHSSSVSSGSGHPDEMATVAIVSGEGLTEIFNGLGVTRTIAGGQSMNPSVKDVLQVVEEINAGQILIFPNNSNIMLTVQHVQKLSARQVHVVPTKTIPQGIAALLTFNRQLDPTANLKNMFEVIEQVVTLEVTYAVRDTTLNGVEITQGAVIGLINGVLAGTGDDENSVVMELLSQLATETYEIITIYVGASGDISKAAMLAQEISGHCPELEVETYSGGQPHYIYIISVE
jgi:DAK2 domain fusion protein YloV